MLDTDILPIGIKLRDLYSRSDIWGSIVTLGVLFGSIYLGTAPERAARAHYGLLDNTVVQHADHNRDGIPQIDERNTFFDGFARSNNFVYRSIDGKPELFFEGTNEKVPREEITDLLRNYKPNADVVSQR